MNALDAVLIIIIALFTIRGIFRGLITELIVLISLIAGFVLAFQFADSGIHVLQKYFPLLPQQAARVISFIVIFVAVNVVLRLLGRLLNKFASFVYLQSLNRIAGGVFALLKSVLIISIVFIILESIPFSAAIQKMIQVDKSVLYYPVRDFGLWLYQAIMAVLPGDLSVTDKILNMMKQADADKLKFLQPH